MKRSTIAIYSLMLCLGGLGSNAMAQEAAADPPTYFVAQTPAQSEPDAEGFIRQWMLLDPISKPNRSNTVFTDSYLRETFYADVYSPLRSHFPKAGEKVKIEKQKLKWHALMSTNYNIHLFRFATQQGIGPYGLLFWASTIVNCPADVENVHLAVGSNSASMWWVNGEEQLILSGDRRMVMDDGVSPRMTLHKGQNIVQGAIINGPGMSNFCVRFIDDNGEPVQGLTIDQALQ